mmetsp:Transcript_4670/g.4811  ORF Transcript_4670/g.4811 Transcript_4670/m.4811 type:complete len:270 (-) Transcript_4670:46-855(-)
MVITAKTAVGLSGEDLLNASRFLKITKGHLLRDKASSHSQLIQTLSTATLIGNSLKTIDDTNSNKATSLINQYKLIQEELLIKLQSLKEELTEEGLGSNSNLPLLNSKDDDISPCLPLNNSSHVNKDDLSLDTKKFAEKSQEHRRDGDTTSAERIHTLLQQQKHISTQEVEEETKIQSILTAELADLTGILREATLQMSTSVIEQNIQLDSIAQNASDNFDELSSQKKKMTEREKGMKSSFFTSIGSIFWILLLFVSTYGIIRIFPKPR